MPAEQQQTTRRHAVPQNVLGVQFKLVGDFTLKQFGIAVLGVIFAFACFHLPIPIIFRVPICTVIILGAIGTAFIPIQDRSMDVWIRNFLRSIYSPTQWIWRKENEMPEYLTTKYYPAKKTVATSVQVQQDKSRQRLQSYLKGLEPTKQKETAIDVVRKSRLAALQIAPPTPAPPVVVVQTPVIAPTPIPTPSPAPVLKPIPPTQPHVPLTPAPTRRDQTAHLSKKLERLQQARSAKPKKQSRQVKAGIDYYKKELVAQQTELGELSVQNDRLQREIQYHQEIGKRNEELINIQKQYQAKIDELQKRLSQTRANELQQQKFKQQAERISQLEKQLREKPLTEVSTVAQKKLEPAPVPEITPVPPPPQAARPPKQTPKETLPLIQPEKPNVISGVALSKEGNLVESAVVIIKDQDGDPVRALKTNNLGQFIVTTPLPDNNYILVINAVNHSFDPVRINLTGSIVQPLVFRAK